MYFTSLYGHILWISHCMLLNVVHLLKIRFFSINIWVLIPKSGLSSWAMTMHICVVKCVFSSLLYSFHPSISSMLHIPITEKCFIAGKSLYAHFEPPKQEIANTVNNRKKKFFIHQIHRTPDTSASYCSFKTDWFRLSPLALALWTLSRLPSPMNAVGASVCVVSLVC